MFIDSFLLSALENCPHLPYYLIRRVRLFYVLCFANFRVLCIANFPLYFFFLVSLTFCVIPYLCLFYFTNSLFIPNYLTSVFHFQKFYLKKKKQQKFYFYFLKNLLGNTFIINISCCKLIFMAPSLFL